MSPETPWVSGSSAALVMIVTSTAVPIDAATWRIVLFIAVPCGISDRGSSFSAAVVTGMSTIAVPSMRAAFTAAMYANEVSASRIVYMNELTVNADIPIDRKNVEEER